LEYSGAGTGPFPIDDYFNNNININNSNNGLAMMGLLVDSLCDTMVCKSAAQGAATIVYACLARAAGTITSEEKGARDDDDCDESLLFQGGDFLVDCHVSKHNIGLVSSSTSSQESDSTDSTSTKEVVLQLQHQCWRNTQTKIQYAGFDDMSEL
jgi:hypothetical protein